MREAAAPTRAQCVRAMAEIHAEMVRLVDERANPVVDLEYDVLAAQFRCWDAWRQVVEDGRGR